MSTNYQLNGQKIRFSKSDFIDKSAKVVFTAYYTCDSLQHEPHTSILVPLNTLKPVVTDIDLPKIYLDVARCLTDKVPFVITNDFYVVSNNNELAIQLIIQDPEVTNMYQCFMLNKSMADIFLNTTDIESISDEIVIENQKYNVKELLEKANSFDKLNEDAAAGSGDAASGYGMQGPAQSGRMGDVVFPEVSASSSEMSMTGSGDFPGTMPNNTSSKRQHEEDEEKLSIAFESMIELLDHNLINESVNLEVRLDEKLLREEFLSIREKLGNIFGVTFSAKTTKTTNESKGNLKLDLHFENKEQITELYQLSTYINVPVLRKAAIVDKDFSCQTMEGITQGKAGDAVVVGVDGEVYPCDFEIFSKTYQLTNTI